MYRNLEGLRYFFAAENRKREFDVRSCEMCKDLVSRYPVGNE